MSMQMEFIKVLPSPQALMEDYPVSKASKLLKLQRDEAIKNIFTGKDDRFLLVIGPCSSDNEDAVLDYVYRLAKLQEKVQDKIFYRTAPVHQQAAYYRRRLQGHAASAFSRG